MTQTDDIVVDTLDVWQDWLPEFDAETINAKYKGVSGEPMTPAEVGAWEKIRELASRFHRRRLVAARKQLACALHLARAMLALQPALASIP